MIVTTNQVRKPVTLILKIMLKKTKHNSTEKVYSESGVCDVYFKIDAKNS